MERPSAENVTKNLTTTSDKIRALARAGYLRNEISKLLGIRYQHVRKVPVDSGFAERSIESIAVGPEPSVQMPGDVLLQSGFRFLGEWRALGNGEFELSTVAPDEPGVCLLA